MNILQNRRNKKEDVKITVDRYSKKKKKQGYRCSCIRAYTVAWNDQKISGEKIGDARSKLLYAEKGHCHSVVKIIVLKKKKREGLPNVIVYWFVFHFKLYYSLKIILYIAYTYIHTHSHKHYCFKLYVYDYYTKMKKKINKVYKVLKTHERFYSGSGTTRTISDNSLRLI